MFGYDASYLSRLTRLTITGLFVLFAAQSAVANIFESLSGNINVSGVQSSSDSTTRSSLRRELSASYTRSLTEYLSMFSSVTYFQTDLDQTHFIGLNKKELVPVIQLVLGHPKVSINGRFARPKTEGTMLSEELTRETYDFTVRTRMINLPILTAFYSRERVFDNSLALGRNQKSNNFNMGVTHNLKNWSLRYVYSRNMYNNVATEHETISQQHVARLVWFKSITGDKPVRLSADYSFNYRTTTDRLPSGDQLLHTVSPATGLYGLQEDPYFGYLEKMPALTDENDTSKTDPLIDIGTGTTNRQVGVNFLTSRAVSGLYVYVDRLSDESVTWSVYISEDGQSWEAHDLNPETIFEVSVNRYKIVFDIVETRFIKAVSGGLNRVEHVFVTEIIPVVEVEADRELTQSNQIHLFNSGVSVSFSDRWSASYNFDYQRVPSVGLAGARDNLGQSVNVNFKATPHLSHSLRLQHGLNRSSGSFSNTSNYVLNYSVRYLPLPTVHLSASTSGRRSVIDGQRDSDNLNISGKARGEPLPGLTIEIKTGISRDQGYIIDRVSNSWRTAFTVGGRASANLDLSLSYAHQTTEVRGDGRRINRDQYNVNVSVRPVRKIYVRSRVSWTRGLNDYLTEMITIGWTISRSLTINSSYRVSYDGDDYKSERLSGGMNFKLNSRTSIHAGYNRNDLSRAGATDTEMISAGFRMRL